MMNEKQEELYKLITAGIRCNRIEDSMDGDFAPSIDPPEFEYGLWIEPRLAAKLRELLKEEITQAKTLCTNVDINV
jgi:hypothetical protein